MRPIASARGIVAGWLLSGSVFVFFGAGWATPTHAQTAVCAEVKIEIKQKLSLERQAFDAVMRINNGLQTSAIENVGVNLTFQDQAGNAVVATSDSSNTTASFFVRVDSLNGVGAIDGTGSVAPKTTGEIRWLIIPAPGSGGIQPQGKLYFVGASLSYTLLSETKTVAVTPESITVRPQPLLTLDYFLPGDVYSDDAFTAPVEPPVPFTLGVRIKNVGGGTAAKTGIESAQPKIVENKQGLLIGFQILGSFVSDQPASNTLLLNLGDISPGASAMGRWVMQTTLSGKFTEFQAGYTHADSLGGAVTSLIQGLTTHLLIHDVKVDLPGRDNVRDFLALDGDTPRVYESEGTDTLVTDQSANARLQAGGGSQYNLNFQATTGFAYVKLTDPFSGQTQPGLVVRSDGKTLPTENVWLSKKRNADLSWSYFVNFFDVNTTGIYSVSLANGGAGASLAGFVYADANVNGQKDAGELGIGVTPVTLTGTDDQGADVHTTTYADRDGAFSFVQLRPGTYSLKVAAVAGYVDGTLAVGSAGGVAAGDTVSGIALSATTNATGYLFAKRTPGPPQADLGLTMTASATQIAAGGNVTFTLVAANAGPAAGVAAKVTDVLPARLTFVGATVSGGGGYDNLSGIWTIGDIAAGGNATLTLIAKVTASDAPITNTATISSAVADPNPGNNSAGTTLNADAGSLLVTQSVLPAARVLALVSCPTAAVPIDPTCISTRTGFLTSYLPALGLDIKVASDTDSFRTAFRAGRYNTYWLSGAADLTETLAQEIREAVFRGDTLVVDGMNLLASGVLDEAIGASSARSGLGNNLMMIMPGVAGNVATAGQAQRLTLKGGQALASFAITGKHPAIVINSYGQGHGVATAFDLVGTLMLPASEQALHGLIVDTLETNAPDVPNAFVGNAYVPVTTAISNNAADMTIELTSTLPNGVTFTDATPAPVEMTATQITWRFALPANKTSFVDLGLRMPQISDTYTLQTTVRKVQGATSTLYDAYNFPLIVGASDQFGPKLISDLLGLNLAKSGERRTRDTAVALLQDARADAAVNLNEDAIQSFLAAGDALDKLASLDPTPYEIATDKWLQEVELRWNPTCPDDVTQQAKVTNGGLVRNRQTGRFVRQVKITAINSISGPVRLQLVNLGANATLFQPTGSTTSCNPPVGSPYVTLSATDLAAGDSVTVKLEFVSATQQAITYSTQVLSGGGGR